MIILRIGRTAALAASFCSAAFADELSVVGTGDGIDVLRVLGASYMAEHPKTSVTIPPSIGSGGGLAAVGSDREVLARVARPLSDAERADGLISAPFLRLPSAIFVNPSAGITELSSGRLADIYAGRVTNWRDVGGANQRIKVVRREDNDSTLLVLRQSMPGWRDLVLTEKSKTATTTQDTIATVKDIEGAIGFGPYTTSLAPELVVLRIDGRFPTDEDYPSAVTVSFVYKSSTVTPEAKSFIAYATSEKARGLVKGMGGVPTSN